MAGYLNIEELQDYQWFARKNTVLTGVSWQKNNGSTSNENELFLDNIGANSNHKDNPNVFYDGGAGTDTLTYSGSKSVTVSVWGDEDGEGEKFGKDYDLFFEGGKESGGGVNKLEVWTTNVEIFDLTSESDTVDLTNLSSGIHTTFYANGGKDTLTGSDNNETFFGEDGRDSLSGGAGHDYLSGGDGNDTIDGGSGDDNLDGGDGNDCIDGGSGDDTIDSGDGANFITGGSGNDVIYTSINLTTSEQNYIAGDWSLDTDSDGDVTFSAGSGYNEADIFVIGYETTGTINLGGGEFGDFFSSSGGTAVVETGSKLLASAVGASWAGPLVEFGITSMIDAIRGGSAAESLYTTNAISAQVTVEDFDPWVDTAVIALDEHSSMVTGGAVINADTQPQLDVKMQGTTFLSLVGDKLTASAMEGLFEDPTITVTLSNAEMTGILNNVYNNGVRVWTTNGTLQATQLVGVDLMLDDEAETLVDLADEIGDNEGVLLLGNMGGGTIYGNSLSAVAGSNSDDVIYAGTYLSNDYASAFVSNSDVDAYAGAGSDTVFGSENDGDRLFGGSGDDYLHIGGTVGEGVDKLFGGEDFDIAAFGNISGVTDRTSGITVDLGATVTATTDFVGAEYATATWILTDGTTGSTAAHLYDIEGIDGTDAADTLTGSDSANILSGNGGSDTISGGAGSDTLQGGAGNDSLDGGDDTDTAIFSGNAEAYSATYDAGSDQFTITGNDGTDTVTAIEYFQFDDFTFSSLELLDELTADVVYNLTDEMNATASQSSTHAVHVAMETFAGEDAFRVLDNDVTTHNHTLTGTNWLAIDLNGDAFIEEIAIENAVWSASVAARLIGAEVTVLNDGEVVWNNIEDGNGPLTEAQYQTLVVNDGVVGDQILIENDTFIHLKEVDVFGDLNLTDVMNATASASSTWNNDVVNEGADKVLDGNTATCNHTASGDQNTSLLVNLGADAFIETVAIANRNDGDASHQAIVNARLAGALLEILDDGEVVGPAYTLTGDVDQMIDVGGIVGDSIRISNGDTYIHIAEVDVYGDLIV